jgi:glycosyltransferase involved in cell wall biosynthesis
MSNFRKPIDAQSKLPWEDGLEIRQAGTELPVLSVVMPVFNAGAFIEKSIRSLMCNDLSRVEIILMDGGSSDNTVEIAHEYAGVFKLIHSGPDEGQSDAINRGYDQATGDILYWLNGDDLVLPNTLTAVREYFAINDQCDVLVGNAYMTELDLTPINHFVFSEQKLAFDYLLDYARNHLIQPSVFFSRQAWQTCGPVKLDHHYAMDADLFLAMASQYRFHHLDLDIAYSVYHEDCKTRDARAESITELALVQARHGGHIEARKTLDLLVDMFNQLKQEKETTSPERGPNDPNYKALMHRIDVLTQEREAQKNLCLEIDLMDKE